MGLLQSKHFRKKIGKWVIMYVVCMMFFTTVVTYSKYVSNLIDSSDTARVSKFKFNLIYCENSEKCDNKSPINRKYRPTKDMEFYFLADARDIEVNANIEYTISVDRHFKVKEVYKDGTKLDIGTSSKEVKFKDSIQAGIENYAKYKVVVSYDEKVVDKDSKGNIINGIVTNPDGSVKYIFNGTNYGILNVGYKIDQIN